MRPAALLAPQRYRDNNPHLQSSLSINLINRDECSRDTLRQPKTITFRHDNIISFWFKTHHPSTGLLQGYGRVKLVDTVCPNSEGHSTVTANLKSDRLFEIITVDLQT